MNTEPNLSREETLEALRSEAESLQSEMSRLSPGYAAMQERKRRLFLILCSITQLETDWRGIHIPLGAKDGLLKSSRFTVLRMKRGLPFKSRRQP